MALPMRVRRTEGADPFQMIQREFDDLLGRLYGRELPIEMAGYCVDVHEDKDHIYVVADMPGFRKEDVDVTIENGTLSISAQRSEERKEGEETDYLLQERRFRRFHRSFTLPQSVDEQHVDAKLADGCLHITLNKREESKPKKIQVS